MQSAGWPAFKISEWNCRITVQTLVSHRRWLTNVSAGSEPKFNWRKTDLEQHKLSKTKTKPWQDGFRHCVLVSALKGSSLNHWVCQTQKSCTPICIQHSAAQKATAHLTVTQSLSAAQAQFPRRQMPSSLCHVGAGQKHISYSSVAICCSASSCQETRALVSMLFQGRAKAHKL